MFKKIVSYRNLHIVSALAILGVFIVAAIAYVQHDVAFIDFMGWQNYEIGKCFYRENFGLTCPSCGLTRSFISIENFHFQDAFSYNRMGIFIYVLFLFVFVFNCLSLVKFKGSGLVGKIVAVYAVLVCAFLVVSWILGLFFGI